MSNRNIQISKLLRLTVTHMDSMITCMSNPEIKWTAEAVQEAIRDAGRSKQSLSDETGIPYSTLNRKLAAKAEFSFTELYILAQALGVHPSSFTPPAFQAPVLRAVSA